MNVLFVSNDPSIFDSDSPVRDRMRRYASQMGSLHIVSRGKREHMKEYGRGVQEGALYLEAVGGGKLLGLLGLISRARHIIRTFDINIVSAQDPFEHGLAALIALGGAKAKLHIQVHTDFCSTWFTRSGNFRSPRVPVPAANHIRRVIADYVLPRADGVRAVSKRVRDSLTARYGSRIPEPSVIPIAVSGTLPEPAPLPPHPFTFAFITVSRLEPEKRIEDVLAALKQIRPLYPSAGLIVVGDGRSRKRLEARVAKLGLEEAVLFLGWRRDALGLMRSAQAYIQASAYEGYGLTLIEAALARIPILSTDVGAIGEVFRGYEEALVVPVADPAALALNMKGMIEDTAARTGYVMRAEEAAKRHLAEQGDLVARVTEDLALTLQKP